MEIKGLEMIVSIARITPEVIFTEGPSETTEGQLESTEGSRVLKIVHTDLELSL